MSAAAVALLLTSAALGPLVADALEGPGRAGSSGAAREPGRDVAAEPPPGALPGIDVSHWNGLIDWPAVAAAGTTFAIAKASEGRSYQDPTYATNEAGATANGIVFGAYHFARPDERRRDPIREADHFLETAQPEPGHIVPVLDVERTGGLSQTDLTRWILRWLRRVTEQLGVRPIVYTSPNGWAERTGDTTAVVDAGYTLLWIAHWGVRTPRLPAEDWGGYGWTFWQYTSRGTVRGIDGRVDLDWFVGPSFRDVTIPHPDVTPPTATIRATGDAGRPVVVSFDEIVTHVTDDNLVVYRDEASANEPMSLTCRSGTGEVVGCRTGKVRRVTVWATEPPVLGEVHHVVVNPPGAIPPIVDRAGNPAPTTPVDYRSPSVVEDGSFAVAYGWRVATSAEARGGSYATERRAGATATFAFSGTRVTWVTMAGPTQGTATVRIDGARRGTFDQYARETRFDVERRFTGLGGGRHEIKIRVLGERSARARDTLVAVDGFEVGRGHVPTPSLAMSWGRSRDARASGGRFAVSDVRGATFEVSFRGTGIAWTTVRGPRHGRAAVYVDGVVARTVDNYASAPAFGGVRTISGLPPGVHTLRVVVLGQARPAADGTLVAVDRLSVLT